MSSDDRPVNRRRVLRTGAALTTAGLFAGCSGDDGGGTDGGDNATDGGDGSGDGGSGDDFPSQEITWIVPYSTGGGFDTYSRGLAEFMPKHLPNEPDIVVQNITGAGGRRGANKISRADPDGYTVGIWNIPGFVVSQLVLDTEYDLNEVSWIGRVAQSKYMLVVNADSEYESLEDLQNADEVRFSQTGPGATGWIMDIVVSKETGINNKEVTGYEGSQEQAAALLRGDVDAFVMTMSSPSIQEPVEQGDFRPIMAISEEPPEWAPDAPTAPELDYPDLANQGLHRLIGGPPGIEDAKLDVLTEGLVDVAESQEMKEWAENQGRPLAPLDRTETSDLVESLFETYSKYEDTFKEELG